MISSGAVAESVDAGDLKSCAGAVIIDEFGWVCPQDSAQPPMMGATRLGSPTRGFSVRVQEADCRVIPLGSARKKAK